MKTISKLFNYPLYVWFAAAYPIIFLVARNVALLDIVGVILILLLTEAIVSVIFVVLWWIFRDSIKAGSITFWLIVCFFAYGHLYNATFLQLKPQYLPPGKFIIAGYFVIMIGYLWVLLRNKKLIQRLTEAFNGMMLFLLLVGIFNVVYFYVLSLNTAPVLDVPQVTVDPQIERPDIYLIILDEYSRQDYMETYLDFDNSAFIQDLRDRGFYVADRSCSNYNMTLASVASILSMNYIDTREVGDLNSVLAINYYVEYAVTNNLIADILRQIGYEYIHFASGMSVTQSADADVLIDFSPDGAFEQEVGRKNNLLDVLAPTTLLLPIWDDLPRFCDNVLHPMSADRILFQFEELKTIPDIEEPTFVITHFMSPHWPYVFDRNGNRIEKPDNWDPRHDLSLPDQAGLHVEQVRFTNQAVLDLIDTILARSDIPPIILIQGDHSNQTNPPILNAYYVNDETKEALYPTITPVNSFRVIFNSYFDTHLELLPDESYRVGGDVLQHFELTDEWLQQCIPDESAETGDVN